MKDYDESEDIDSMSSEDENEDDCGSDLEGHCTIVDADLHDVPAFALAYLVRICARGTISRYIGVTLPTAMLS